MITNEVRPPAVAGMFYEREPDKLRSHINEFMIEAEPKKINGKILGIVSPHAGYFYSGKTAAYGYKLLKGQKIDTVIVISPSHYEYFKGVSVYNGSAYMTPLGVVEVDNQLRDSIAEHKGIISISKAGHTREHALEVQIPFLQMVLDEFKIVPIVMGDQKREYCQTLAEVLAEELVGKNIVMVASSDLSHYYTHEVANELDSKVQKHIESFNHNRLMKDLEEENVQACGGGPIITVMQASQLLGADKSKVLYRCDSSEASGDFRQVVGYLSAVFYKEI